MSQEHQNIINELCNNPITVDWDKVGLPKNANKRLLQKKYREGFEDGMGHLKLLLCKEYNETNN